MGENVPVDDDIRIGKREFVEWYLREQAKGMPIPPDRYLEAMRDAFLTGVELGLEINY